MSFEIQEFQKYKNVRLASDGNTKTLYVADVDAFGGFVGYQFCGVHKYASFQGNVSKCVELPHWSVVNLGYATNGPNFNSSKVDLISKYYDKAVVLDSGEIIATCQYN